ncbi:MAG: DUF3488 and DUF4129 domain-containing transglutaminase family protein [Bdellovibrionales bacterium]
MNPLSALTRPLLVLVGFNLLPSFLSRPLWFTALALILFGYRMMLDIWDRGMPPRIILLVGQATVAVAVWQHYHTLFGDEASGTWLTLLSCLKIYELRRKSDYYVTTLLCFLILMGSLLLDQSLGLTVYMLIDLVLIFGFLYALQEERWKWWDWRKTVRPTFGLILKSLPILILAFVLFPRFSTGFGTGDRRTAKTGMSADLRPGSVANIIKSDELVFRASFLDGAIPPHQDLYWRGAVLDKSTGLNWDRSQNQRVQRAPQAYGRTSEIEIYLEPGQEKFLFVLEGTRSIFWPNERTHAMVRREGGVFELSQNFQTRDRYYLESDPNLPPEDLDLDRYLQLSGKPTRKMKEFLKSFKSKSVTETVSKLMAEFGNGKYSYSLTPPAVDDLDEFLFNTRSGFCEHYAGAMATLLRHLGIPSRVVVGYQGGTRSFLDNYVSVRGHDAHAWLEYYNPATKRWRRADPTAEVAPTRITVGSESLTSNEWMPGWVPKGWTSAYLKSRRLVDEVEAAWIGFLVGFDINKQKKFLERLGMEAVLFRALPVFLLLAIALVLSILYFLESQSREEIAIEDRLYMKLVRALKKHKIQKKDHQGPLALAEEVARHEALAARVLPILDRLTLARYGRNPLDRSEVRTLKKSISRV